MNTTTMTPLSLPALDRWAAFAESLADPTSVAYLDTQDVVAALIDRSLVEDELQAGASFADADLVRLVRADQRYRAVAADILDRTDIALFRDDEPPTHWWWNVEQLVLGQAGERLLAVPAAAALKGVHPHTIRSAIRDGRLPARRLARGFLVYRRDLERWQPRPVGRPRGTRSTTASDTLLEAFNEANTSGDWTRAAKLAEAMEREPSTPRRCLAVAITAFNQGDDAKAEAWAARALEGDLPQQSRQTALLVQGRALLRQRHPRKALGVLESARGLGYSDWLLDAGLADAYLDSGDARRAVEVARRACDAAPDVPEVHYQLARMLWHHDEPMEALEEVVRFRTYEPDAPDAVLLHASVLGLLGDRTGDTRLYRRVRDVVRPLVERGAAEAQAMEGQALGSLGDWRAAFRIARELLRRPDDDGDIRHRAWHIVKATVDAAMNRGHPGPVVAAARELLGPDEYLDSQLALMCALGGDVEGALAALGTSLDALPSADVPRRIVAAHALSAAGRAQEAYALLKSIRDDLPEGSLIALTEAALTAGDLAGARDALSAIAAGQGTVGRVAALALKVMESAPRVEPAPTRASVPDRRTAAWLWQDSGLAQHPAARESTWEGRHRRTSPVIDGLTGRYLH